MQGKFIYVFNSDTRDKLIALGYRLLKINDSRNIYVFENSKRLTFSENETNNFKLVFSDTLTF